MEVTMNNINKDISKALTISIIASIMLVVGIPGIILSAIHIPQLLALPIVCTVLGFYGSPMLWMWYANLLSYKSILKVIVNEKITNIDEISAMLGISKQRVISSINTLMKKEYLTGYKFINNTLTINQDKYQAGSYKCPNCGASLIDMDKKKYCPYCKSRF